MSERRWEVSIRRWEVSILIGPCSQGRAELFIERLIDYLEATPEDDPAYGTVVGLAPWKEEGS